MKKFSLGYVLVFIWCLEIWLGMPKAQAQEIIAKLTVDSTTILIGDHLALTVEVFSPVGATVQWPIFSDHLDGFEILHQSAIDSSVLGHTIKRKQIITVIAFESRPFAIAPIAFILLKDTAEISFFTEPLTIDCNTIPVDIEQPFLDIAGSVTLPYQFQEYYPFLLGLVLILLLSGIFYFQKTQGSLYIIWKRAWTPNFYRSTIRQMRKLEKLSAEQEDEQVYAAVPVILRQYLENRYAFSSKSASSKEIIQHLQSKKLDSRAIQQLEDVFNTVDKAKFSKASTTRLVNTLLLDKAYSFLQFTKLKN